MRDGSPPERPFAQNARPAGTPSGMYEGVGSCQGRDVACSRCDGRGRGVCCQRDGDRGGLMGWCCAHPAGCGRVFPSTDSRGVRGPWGGQARLPRHVSAPVHAHDGIGGHGQVGLNQFFDRNAPLAWVMPLGELAAWSCPSLTRRSPRSARGSGSRRRAGRSRPA